MSEMADRNGADLAMASQFGHLAPEDHLAAVQSCSGCTCPEACDRFLKTDEKGIPDYCRNADLIRNLAGLTPD